jgi:acyl-CoA dehydrogenase
VPHHYEIPANTLIGAEGQGLKVILHGMNAEGCLLASEVLGLRYAVLEKAAAYAKGRVIFWRTLKLATYHAARLYD